MTRFRHGLHPKSAYGILVSAHDQQDRKINRGNGLQNEFEDSWNLNISALVHLLPSVLQSQRSREKPLFQWSQVAPALDIQPVVHHQSLISELSCVLSCHIINLSQITIVSLA